MTLEGRVRVAARFDGERIESVSVRSDRPLAANALLAGRTGEEALALLPGVFAVCGHSQATVAAAAIDAAAGTAPPQAVQRRRERELVAETASEHAFRLLLDWPRLAGVEEDVTLLARVRSLLARAPESEASWGAARDALIGMVQSRILGAGLDTWLEQFSASEWLEWARSGRTATARTLAALCPATEWAAPDTAFLTDLGRARLAGKIALPALGQPGFEARPELDGGTAECGPLARNHLHPALRDLARRDRIVARAFARLAEFAQILREENCAGRIDQVALGPGRGAATGEMARGLLTHAVELDAGRVRRYAIVAPTEWNFHPAGPLYRELEGRPARDAGAARRALEIAAATLDPCVELQCELEGEPSHA
jgi:coenzyme F420-reducing hydrogenase alpha subunit